MPKSLPGKHLPWWKSLRSKLFLAFSFPVVFFVIFILFFSSFQLKKHAYETIQEKSIALNDFLAISLESALVFDDAETADFEINAARQNPNLTCLVLYDAKGNYFAGYGEEKIGDFATVKGTNSRVSEKLSIWLFSTPVMHSGTQIGQLVLGHSLLEVNKRIQRSRINYLLFSTLFLLMGLGFVFWVSTALTRNLIHIVNVVRKVRKGDFTERAQVKTVDEVGILARSLNSMMRRMEKSTAEIKKREIQFRGLAEHMSEGLARFDQAREIQYVNPRFCEIFNVNANRVEGWNIEKIIQPENLNHGFLAELEKTKGGQFEIKCWGKGDRPIWLLVSFTNIQVANEPDQTVTLFTDITKIKAAEEELVYKNRELDTFVYKASHDLKAPLASMKGLIEVYNSSSVEEQGDLMPLIERTVDKMDGVLLGLLEVTWIKQGALEQEEIQMGPLIETILSSIQHAKGFNEVEIRKSFDPNIIMVGDYKMLSSVLQNLIQNGIKYHREEGDGRWVEIQMMQNEDKNRIAIMDNGPGIPKSSQPKLFDMFYRATNKSKGSGLGLYIVKTSLDKLGGIIALKSQVGLGTEFHLEFPRISLPEKVPSEEINS